jgi:Domain of unknown function (DUF4349)
MTVIDEEVLRRELLSTANEFEVASDAVERVMATARSPLSEKNPPRVISSVRGHPRRQRWLVAAAMVAAVTAIAIPLVRTESPLRLNALRPAGHATPYGLYSGSVTGAPRVISGTGFVPMTQKAVNLGVVETSSKVSTNSLVSSTKIESSGQVNLTVAKGRIGSSLTRLAQQATSDGGSVVSSQLQTANRVNGGFAFGTIVLQVPQPRFSALVIQVQGVGHVTQVATSSVDVTGQYVDLTARITALQASRRQYLAILARASSINDILAVQSQLNTLQGRIEELQGQLQLLGHETTYGSLTVNVTESGHHHHVTKSSNGIAHAFRQAVHGFVAGFEGLIRASGPVLFAILCLGVLGLLGRRAWRSLRRHSL